MTRVWLPIMAMCTLLLVGCATTPSLDAETERESAGIHFQLGVEHLRRNQYGKAETNLRRSLALDDRSADTHTAMGVLYQQTSRPDDAEKSFRRALTLSPDNPAVQNNLGVFLCERDQREEGEQLLLKAARSARYVTPEAAWTNAAVCIRPLAADRAEGYLRQALSVNPCFPTRCCKWRRSVSRSRNICAAEAFCRATNRSGRRCLNPC